jgi:segregation and condensation protein A
MPVMDERVDPDGGLTGAPEPAKSEETGSPHLALDGFAGPLDHLLTLARAHKIDLSDISVAALVEQLATALRQAPANMPLGQKGDWVVMAAWLVQLRSLLLLPADAPARQDAAIDANALRGHLVALADIQALAGWLERRPQLGHDVFARGRPPPRAQSSEIVGVSREAAPAMDVIEFLWASLALCDDAPVPDIAAVYRPVRLDLHTMADARDRILRRLAETTKGVPFERLLPDQDPAADLTEHVRLRRRSGWASTFAASLELARQSEVALEQEAAFTPIHVRPATVVS